MQIGLHVGLTTVTHDVRALLALNSDALASRGWRVAPEAHDPLPAQYESRYWLHAAEQTLGTWSRWLASSDADGVILSCAHLGDALLVDRQASTFIAGLPSEAALVCAAVVRRIDDYVATRYVQELLVGRTRRLAERELAGRGVSNYLSRLNRWKEAPDTAFRALPCPPSGSDGLVILQLMETLGVPDAHSLQLPGPSAVKLLDGTGSETLRRLNRLLSRSEIETEHAQAIRDAAVAELTAELVDRPFTIPADSAARLLRDFASSAAALSDAMSPEQAERFLAPEIPPDRPVDESQVTERLQALASKHNLTVEADSPRSDADQALSDVRQAAQRARTAHREHDVDRYRRLTRRIRRSIPLLPEYREQGVGRRDTAPIPARVLQFWDPSPPPEEMEPWFASWETLGLPGGHHEVANYQMGLDAVREVAGEIGSRAYEVAPHPAVRSDLYRYAELHLRGGWYVDAEHEALLSLPDVLHWRVDHVFVIRPNKHRVANGFIGAVAGSALMKEALLRGCRNLLEGSGRSVGELTGPLMFTALVDEYVQTPAASFVILPTNVVFGGVFQKVHNLAEYKTHGHWRHADLSKDGGQLGRDH